MLGKRIINTGGVSCTTDTTQILNAGLTQSTALYRFEDNVYDTSESTGYINKGARFNGSDSKITISGSPFNLTTYSLSFWIYADDYNQSAASIVNIGLDNTGGTWGGLAFGVNTNKVFYYGGDSGFFTQTGTTNITNANWVHVAMVVNGTSITGYVNGTQDSGLSKTLGSNIAYRGGSINTIGVRQGAFGSYGWWNGNVDELRVYNDALTATEIGYIANNTTASIPTANLIAFYSFEGNANDSTSNNNNGTASNVRYDYSGTASNITYTTGKFGKAIEFNGSTGFMNVENMSTVLANNFTVSMWVKTPSSLATSGYPTFISLYGYLGYGSAYGWSVEYVGAGASSKFSFYWVSASHQGNNVSSGPISPNTWYHVLVKKNSSSASLYINGQLDHSGGTSINSYGMYYNTITDLTFGAKRLTDGGSISSQFTGLVDQVRLFTKQLNAGEINSLYNETATSAASATIDNPSTIAYYKMQDAKDETGSYNGTPTDVDFNVQGKYGFAGKFNGSSSRINTGLTWPGGTEISCSLWINTAGGVNQYLFGSFNDSGSNSSNRLAFQFHNSNVLYILTNDASGGMGTTTNAGSIASYLNKWTHIVVTVSGTEVKAYLDGSLFHTSTGTALAAGSYPFIIGAYTDNSSRQNVNGKIDQVRIFNKAISASEVTKLYNEIQCANTIDTPESYFNTKLYTGNGSTQALTGVGFAPAFVWIKARSVGYSHSLQDTVRGPGTGTSLYSDLQSAQGTYGAYGQISAFGTDGFTVASGGHGVHPVAQVNKSGVTYASWNWKGASSSVTNNVGTITSTVSASPESGFSVVKYTATGTIITNTVGHGLTTQPSLIIQKGANTTSNWFPITDVIDGSVDYLMLNSNGAKGDMSGIYADFSINDTTFTNWYSNTSGEIITYCFANVDGYQRIGSYIGNGSTTGPYIYTGFEPAWIMIKRTDAAGAWNIFDNKRNSANPRNSILQADKADQEYTNTAYNFNFYTNGFQSLNSNNDWNASGGSYIFIAIAANPDITAPTKANSFKTKIYTGNGSARSFTDVGLKPDFVWIKKRGNDTKAHRLFDSVRGPNNVIYSNLTNAAATPTDELTAFIDGGFSLGTASAVNDGASDTYVAWNWKGLDHDRNLAAINNNGSITSKVSANPQAGFSIVNWSATTTGSDLVGHGLSAKPQIIIMKNVSSASTNWFVFSDIFDGSYDFLYLNTTAAKANSSRNVPTATVFDQGNLGGVSAGNNCIAYCFHSVTGYSSIGTYTGNGSTTGPSVTVGFRPSWVLIKKSSGTGGWYIFDAVRSGSTTFFPKILYPNVSNVEYDTTGTAFDGQGITTTATTFEVDFSSAWTDLNASGTTYLYMAFK